MCDEAQRFRTKVIEHGFPLPNADCGTFRVQRCVAGVLRHSTHNFRFHVYRILQVLQREDEHDESDRDLLDVTLRDERFEASLFLVLELGPVRQNFCEPNDWNQACF